VVIYIWCLLDLLEVDIGDLFVAALASCLAAGGT
jgi:hypothetical protein